VVGRVGGVLREISGLRSVVGELSEDLLVLSFAMVRGSRVVGLLEGGCRRRRRVVSSIVRLVAFLLLTSSLLIHLLVPCRLPGSLAPRQRRRRSRSSNGSRSRCGNDLLLSLPFVRLRRSDDDLLLGRSSTSSLSRSFPFPLGSLEDDWFVRRTSSSSCSVGRVVVVIVCFLLLLLDNVLVRA